MKSLTLRFTLSFLLVSLIAIAFLGIQFINLARGEFSQFFLSSNQQGLLTSLESYYSQNGSWDGVLSSIQSSDFYSNYSEHIALFDQEGNFIFGDKEELEEGELSGQVPVMVNGQQVGTLLVEADDGLNFDALSPEGEFLSRLLTRTLIIIGGAIVFSLIVGSLIARSLSRPISELTQASQRIADGDFDQQVPVRSNDEIGRLAESFNLMSRFVADSTKQRRQMTADIAHELRTPLSVISGYAEGLNDGTLKANTENLDILSSEVILLNRLVEDLRLLSLSDADELNLELRPTELKSLLVQIISAHSKAAQEKNLELKLDIPAALPDLMLDAERMSQVFKNLIANAIRYSESGTILVSANLIGPTVEIAITDNGPGISAHDLEHIFDRFYRADQSRSRAPEGSSGLGLAIAKALVQAHGGQISAQSEPDQGSTFTVSLAS
jgi:signal transduction histidine kinase